jgi:hypothetical protein
MGKDRVVALPVGPAIAGPRTGAVRASQVTINVGGETEDGRAFFGTDAVREIDSP